MRAWTWGPGYAGLVMCERNDDSKEVLDLGLPLSIVVPLTHHQPPKAAARSRLLTARLDERSSPWIFMSLMVNSF